MAAAGPTTGSRRAPPPRARARRRAGRRRPRAATRRLRPTSSRRRSARTSLPPATTRSRRVGETSLFAGGPWRAASPAAGGSPRRSESSTARDEALARALAREDGDPADAALARRLALAPEGGLAEPWQAPASAHEAVPGHADFGTDQGMIFVACDIAGTRTEMMVDTGAQMSVISLPTARRLGLMGRLDQSQQGVAAGVGHARIYGKLRRVPIRLGHVEFELDLSVLGVDDDLLMLGIDQMHRFNVIVDLQQRCLVFGGRDGIEVPFLPPRPRVPRLSAGCPQM
ncbi:unnamed protein product [Prorocentrum cordatum]|uniref:Aspartic peptidase DDI1-type domain-containing protein n=1 Tax=Prorocentrum cordatum TaxID=2364126 RepID=A0ABN9U7C8_9DINO|nr:unnamed protein product [Polarella glacialis]